MPPPAPNPRTLPRGAGLKAIFKLNFSTPILTHSSVPSHSVSRSLDIIEHALDDIALTGSHWPPDERDLALDTYVERSKQLPGLVSRCEEAFGGGFLNTKLKVETQDLLQGTQRWKKTVKASSDTAHIQNDIPVSDRIRPGKQGSLGDKLKRVMSLGKDVVHESGYRSLEERIPPPTPFPPPADAPRRRPQMHLVGEPASSNTSSIDAPSDLTPQGQPEYPRATLLPCDSLDAERHAGPPAYSDIFSSEQGLSEPRRYHPPVTVQSFA
ncbi:hypothetical protein MKEN_01047600 [Mycena kentingensis (nom. inval.)]|nr:hypothetical protein MKEN_01047600 [Mycena kentingensis (nom. inval.)]